MKVLHTGLMIAAWAATANAVEAQIVIAGDRPSAGQFAVNHDNEAEGWLRKAREAAASSDWKLLADTLSRVLEHDGLRTVAMEEGGTTPVRKYSAANVEAWRILSAAGKEALAAYRLTYDAEASRQFEAVKSSRNIAALRGFLARYRPTTSGSLAADLLATWLLDDGQWFEALRALDSLEAFPHEPVPRWSIELRRAAAMAALGQQEGAAQAVQRVRAMPRSAQPADFEERAVELERLIADPSPIHPVAAATRWPWLLGEGTSAGRMAAVEPSLVGEASAQFELPDGPFINVSEALAVCVQANRAPVWEAVTDGRTLFVGTPTGFAALEPQSLTYRWLPITSAEKARRQTARPRVNRWMIQQQRGVGRREGALPPRDARPVYDELAGTLATFGGKVFCIEQPQQSANDYSGLIDSETLSDLVENTLGAYDAQSGKLLWRKGRAGPVEDGLLDAHFFAAPVPVGERIGAICRLGPDLLLLLMEQNGRIVERVPLGSAPESVFPASRVLPMALADGDLIVQTGMGLVICLDATNLSLRWTTPYERAMDNTTQTVGRMRIVMGEGDALPDGWLRNPPLVRGDRVIVAPADSADLLCLDRRDGRVRWQATRSRLRYLVGMDDQHVYATGDRITAIRATDGTEAWSVSGPQLTGRAVLSGSRLLVPTMSGLLTLSASSGKKIATAGGENAGRMLGNLFAWEGALYSLEINRVRRYADITRELESASRRLKADPGDDEARIRLAWIHLAKADHAAVLRVLDEPVRRGPGFGSEPPAALAGEESNHLRVQALLGASRATGATADAAAAMLERAGRLASRPQDLVDVARCVSMREIEAGRPGLAMERTLAALGRAGDAAVSLDENYAARASVVLGGLLRNAWNACDDAERARLEAMLAEEAEHSKQRNDLASAQWLADALGFAPAAAALDDWLAARDRDAGLSDSASFYERRAAVRRGTATREEAEGSPTSQSSLTMSDIVLRPDAAFDPQGSQNVMGVWTPDGPESAAREIAVMVTNESLIGVGLGDMTTRWRVDLMNVLTDEASNMESRMAGLRGLRGPAAVTGWAAAIPSFSGLQLVGLKTGTMLARPVTPPEAMETQMPDVPAAAVGGMIVAAMDPQSVAGIPARNGAAPAWRRALDLSRIGRIATVGNAVVVAASDWSVAWLLDPANGRLRGRIALEAEPEAEMKPDDDNGLLFKRSLMTERMIILARGRELTARRLPDGGIAWTKKLLHAGRDIRMLDAEHVGVSMDDTFVVLAESDGREVGRMAVKDAILPPADAILNDAGHVVMVLRTNETPSQVKLEWYELSSGERLVSHGSWPAALVSPRMLRASSDLVAVARYEVTRVTQLGPGIQMMQQPMGGRGGVETPVVSWKTGMLNLYNKRTGARVGRPLEIGGVTPIVDVLFRGDRLAVVTQRGWQSFVMQSEP